MHAKSLSLDLKSASLELDPSRDARITNLSVKAAQASPKGPSTNTIVLIPPSETSFVASGFPWVHGLREIIEPHCHLEPGTSYRPHDGEISTEVRKHLWKILSALAKVGVDSVRPDGSGRIGTAVGILPAGTTVTDIDPIIRDEEWHPISQKQWREPSIIAPRPILPSEDPAGVMVWVSHWKAAVVEVLSDAPYATVLKLRRPAKTRKPKPLEKIVNWARGWLPKLKKKSPETVEPSTKIIRKLIPQSGREESGPRKMIENEIAIYEKLGKSPAKKVIPKITRHEHGFDLDNLGRNIFSSILVKATKWGKASEEMKEPYFRTMCETFGRWADAISLVHEEGVIIGDVKPDNTAIVEGYRVKLFDFGISQDTTRENLELEERRKEFCVGTPPYVCIDTDTNDERPMGIGSKRRDILALIISFIGDVIVPIIEGMSKNDPRIKDHLHKTGNFFGGDGKVTFFSSERTRRYVTEKRDTAPTRERQKLYESLLNALNYCTETDEEELDARKIRNFFNAMAERGPKEFGLI